MKILGCFSWPFNGIENAMNYKEGFHGVVVHGLFMRPLNSWPMKSPWLSINIERLIDHEKYSWLFEDL